MTDASKRAYVRGLCEGELASFTCINGDDRKLLASLPPKLWADPDHLKDKGAAIYMTWLAEQLASSGILDDHLALRGAFDPKAAR